MNDFTKTELKELKRCLKYMIDGCTTPYSCFTIGLHKKITKMIDGQQSGIMETEERERKFKIYREQILPQYGGDPDKVPPYLEPDFNEGWR